MAETIQKNAPDLSYQIFIDATTDICEEMLEGIPHVEIIPMQVQVGEEEYLFGPGGNLTAEEFYAMQRSGKFASTSQINPEVYRSCFEPVLKEGKDIVYLCFTSGMSGTINTANLVMKALREEYPQRKLACIDTLCASIGLGLLMREAALRQKKGMSFEELVEWVEKNKLLVCHWFTVDTFEHLRRGGRVSAASAAMGTVLNIKPLLRVDEAGTLKVMEKPRGRSRSIRSQLKKMEEGWQPGLGKLVVIGHGGCPEDAKRLEESVREKYPDTEIFTAYIGPVIGAHTGPGMLALVYWGNNR